MDASTFEKKVASILDEYLASSDEQEASECIQELKASDELLTTLPTVAVLHVMEKKATDRTKVDELIGHWCAKSILKEDHIIGGLTGLMEMLPDLEIDVPMYGKYLATTMGVIFSAKCIPGTAMKDIVGDMLGTPHAPKVLIWMFESIICTHSLDAAKKIYLETQMRGLDFIPGEDKGDGELDRWITKVCKCTSDMMWLFTPDPIEDLSIAP